MGTADTFGNDPEVWMKASLVVTPVLLMLAYMWGTHHTREARTQQGWPPNPAATAKSDTGGLNFSGQPIRSQPSSRW